MELPAMVPTQPCSGVERAFAYPALADIQQVERRTPVAAK
jgi:hypothetical protein